VTAVEPAVCGDETWCGLPAGHPVDEPGTSRAVLLGGHRVNYDGAHADMPADIYHADPVLGGSLSSTGARRIVGRGGCPAKFAHTRANGQAPRKVWDVGRAAHEKILGKGAGVMVIPDNVTAKNGAWSTDAAKDLVTQARAKGLTPMKPADAAAVDAMAEAVLGDPDARALLEPGASEVALFWTDPDTNVVCRTMLDKLPPQTPGGLFRLADLKTVASAEPDALRRAMGDHGYHQQAEWCETGVESLGLCAPGDAEMVFVAVEKEPPHVVTLYRPDAIARIRAAERNQAARVIYAKCEASGRWPGYVDEITGWGTERIIDLSLLPWRENEEISAS
jgi:hypothetical protein